MGALKQKCSSWIKQSKASFWLDETETQVQVSSFPSLIISSITFKKRQHQRDKIAALKIFFHPSLPFTKFQFTLWGLWYHFLAFCIISYLLPPTCQWGIQGKQVKKLSFHILREVRFQTKLGVQAKLWENTAGSLAVRLRGQTRPGVQQRQLLWRSWVFALRRPEMQSTSTCQDWSLDMQDVCLFI